MQKEFDPVEDREAVKQPEMELEPIPSADDEKRVADEKRLPGEPRPNTLGGRSGSSG